MITSTFSSCSNKPPSGNKISVDNIHKGSGKFDRDTLYISALNVDSPQNTSIIKGDILNVGVKYLKGRSLNPYYIESKSDQYIVDSMWEPLMKVGYDGEYYPNILKQLPTVSEDRHTYLFSLREDLLWQDGTKLTTKDIDFTFKFLMDGTYKGSFDPDLLKIKGYEAYRDNTSDKIEGVEILDDYNFRIIVDTPTIYTLNLLNIYPLSYTYYGEHYYQGGAEDLMSKDIRPFGNGVYKFLGFSEGDYLTLEANSFYFKGKTSISSLTCKQVEEDNMVNSLTSLEIDIAKDVLLNDKNIIEVSKTPFLNGYLFDNFEYASIAINHSNEFLKDSKIREVINLAIDKNQIIKNISNGNYNIIDVPLDMTFHTLYDKDYSWDHDVKTSMSILKDLGFVKNKDGIYEKDGKPLQFSFYINKDSALSETIYNVVEDSLKKIGISLVKQEVELKGITEISSIKDKYDLYLMTPNFTWITSWTKSFMTGSRDNYYDYSNSSLDEVLNKILVEFSIDNISTLYEEAYNIIKSDLPVIPLFRNKHFDVYNGRVLGINTVNSFKTFYYDEIILKK